MKKSLLDFDGENPRMGPVWEIDKPKIIGPDTVPHWVPLEPEAIRILKEEVLPYAQDSPWAFPGRDRQKHLTAMQRWKDQLQTLSGVENFSIHDLRATVQTVTGALGCTRAGIDALLDHTEQGVGHTHYARNPVGRKLGLLPEARVVAKAMEEHILSVVYG